MAEAKTLRTYADVFAAPRRYEPGGTLHAPTSADLAAAYALRLQADLIDVWTGNKTIEETLDG